MNPVAKDLVQRFVEYHFSHKTKYMKGLKREIKKMLIARGFKDEIRKFKITKADDSGNINFFERD